LQTPVSSCCHQSFPWLSSANLQCKKKFACTTRNFKPEIKETSESDKKSSWLATYEKPCGKRLRGASSSGKDIESNFRCRMLRLAQGVAVIRAFEKLAIEHHCGLEARRMVRSFPDASVRWQIEAAPLRKLLKLILVHTCSKQARFHHPFCTPRLSLKSTEIVVYYTLLIHSFIHSFSLSLYPGLQVIPRTHPM
jgi:hypothetical protein